MIIDDFGKDVFRYIIGGAHDLESLYVSFKVGCYHFFDEISTNQFFTSISS